MTKKTTLEELKDLTKNAKKPGEPCSSMEDLPLSIFLTLRIQGAFWQMLDKDFGKKVDNDSIHEIFHLVFEQLNEKQLINILNEIDPKGLSKILSDIKGSKINE
jgi:hypothetical protein